MSRRVAAAIGATLVVMSVAVLILGPSAEPTSTERADGVARELRCPDCQGLSVADSPTQSASEIRRQIDEMLASGSSPDEVRAHFAARYGEWILLAPSAPVAWIVPFAVVIVAAVGLLIWLARARTRQPIAVPAPEELRRRMHEEADALDA